MNTEQDCSSSSTEALRNRPCVCVGWSDSVRVSWSLGERWPVRRRQPTTLLATPAPVSALLYDVLSPRQIDSAARSPAPGGWCVCRGSQAVRQCGGGWFLTGLSASQPVHGRVLQRNAPIKLTSRSCAARLDTAITSDSLGKKHWSSHLEGAALSRTITNETRLHAERC